MKLDKYNVIQLHVVLVLFGYYFVSSVLNLIIGDIDQTISIGYRLFQFLVSVYVLFLCRKNILEIKGHSLFVICLIAILFFSCRIVFDICFGPFSNLPKALLFRDFFFYVIGVYFSSFVVFLSCKYINIEKVVLISFWMLFIAIICIILNISNIEIDLNEERLDAGRGLSTLNIIRIGVFEVLLSIHLLLNRNFNIIKRIIFIIGLCLGIYTIMISGSRGGLVSLVFSLFIYFLIRNRRNIFKIILILISLIVVLLNIIPILEWIGTYFPVISQRMLLTIVEGDQSDREILREFAMQKIIENPLLGYSYRLFPTEYVWSSHNGILDVLQISGIPIGIFFLYFFYIKTTLLCIKVANNNNFFFPILLLLYSLIYSLSGGLIYSSVFWVSVALLYSYYYNNKNNI